MSDRFWPGILRIDPPTWAEQQNLQFSGLLILKIASFIGSFIVFCKLLVSLFEFESLSPIGLIQLVLFSILLYVHLSSQNFACVRRGSVLVVVSLSVAITWALIASPRPHTSGSYHFISGIMLFAGFLLGLRYVLALWGFFSLVYVGFALNLFAPDAPTHLYVDRLAELMIVTLFVALYHRLKERQYRIIAEQERASIHKEKLLSINRMAGGIAHEINNPLAIVMGYIEIMSNQDSQKPLDRHVLSRITQACERISSIVSSILKLTRDGHGASMDVVSLRESCQTHCREFTGSSNFAQVHCQIHVDALKFSIPGGSWDLILKPILQNAFEASIHQSLPKVQVISDLRESYLQLTIADNGPPFDETEISNFFEPFYTRKLDEQGHGMGLTIAYVLATRLGWTIHMNREGKWTRVRLKIPLASVEELVPPTHKHDSVATA